jgi:preprotein translocase subunit SecE
VSWPTWPELQSSAVVVLVAMLIFALLIFGVDTLFQALLNLVYQLFA